jgi:hypothetical protein
MSKKLYIPTHSEPYRISMDARLEQILHGNSSKYEVTFILAEDPRKASSSTVTSAGRN